jgi:lipid A 3-O-deacylase
LQAGVIGPGLHPGPHLFTISHPIRKSKLQTVKKNLIPIQLTALLLALNFYSLNGPSTVLAQAPVIDRYGISAGFGINFHPPDTQVRMIFLDPYVSHDFGDSWRGNLEAFIGTTLAPENRIAVGLTPMAQYALDGFSWPDWFVEAGVGLFYTDVKVPGFGSNWVFSPQAGVGRIFRIDSKKSLTLRLRYHHLSNAYLNKENTSIDGLLLMVGMDFWK